jgi:uncharacterized membrane protein
MLLFKIVLVGVEVGLLALFVTEIRASSMSRTSKTVWLASLLLIQVPVALAWLLVRKRYGVRDRSRQRMRHVRHAVGVGVLLLPLLLAAVVLVHRLGQSDQPKLIAVPPHIRPALTPRRG